MISISFCWKFGLFARFGYNQGLDCMRCDTDFGEMHLFLLVCLLSTHVYCANFSMIRASIVCANVDFIEIDLFLHIYTCLHMYTLLTNHLLIWLVRLGFLSVELFRCISVIQNSFFLIL